MPATRLAANAQRRRPRWRTRRSAVCVSPNTVKPTMIPIVPPHVNSGSVAMKRIQSRATMPSANPPTMPAPIVVAICRTRGWGVAPLGTRRSYEPDADSRHAATLGP